MKEQQQQPEAAKATQQKGVNKTLIFFRPYHRFVHTEKSTDDAGAAHTVSDPSHTFEHKRKCPTQHVGCRSIRTVHQTQQQAVKKALAFCMS